MVMIKKVYRQFLDQTQLDCRKLMNAYVKLQLKNEKIKEIKTKIIYPNETIKLITMNKDSITYDLHGIVNELLSEIAKDNDENVVEDFYLMSFQKSIPNKIFFKLNDCQSRE